MSDSLWPHVLQHTRLSCSSLSSAICSNSCSLSWWCHPTISSSVVPFSFYLQSFPAWGSFPMSWLFAWGGQSIGASASASVLPMNIQNWFPLVLIGLISLLSKRLSKVFSITTVWKHQFFSTQPSLIAQLIKNPPAKQETTVWSLSWEDPVEKAKATHSSILAWRIPWTVCSLGYE